jgi:hypothetical protein
MIIVIIALFLIVGVVAAYMMYAEPYEAPTYKRDPETGKWTDDGN